MHILTLFLTLLVICVSVIIAFTYIKNASSILEFSKGTIERVSSLIEEKILCLLSDHKKLTAMAASLLPSQEKISIDNKSFIDFMLTAVKENPSLYGFYVGTDEGYFLNAIHLKKTNQTHYLSEPSKFLPSDAVYAIREVSHANMQPKETWYYKDASFHTLADESFTTQYDPRLRPWYQGAEKTHQLFWTDVYPFDPTHELGITVADPLFNEKKELFGVVGADVSLNNLSDFLISQKIGKSGKAFILDSSGKRLIPEKMSNGLANLVYQHYHQKQAENFLLEYKGKIYLAHAHYFLSPFEKNWLGVIVAPLNDFFGDIFKTLQQTVLISFLILVLSAAVIYYFSRLVSKPIVQLTKEVDSIRHLDLESEARVKSHIQEISLLDDSIASMRQVLRSFGRYVPKEIVRQLLEQRKEIELGGEKKVVTVFFSDITDFTQIAESHPLDEVMSPLANYYDALSKIILSTKGTIDKYIGDSIMALWGAPSEIPNHAEAACTAALLCQRAVQAFNLERKKNQKPEFLTRIGIHTGEVIVGNIGTKERMNYTVMGDVVNEASRLQQVNKFYHTSILISGEVYDQIKALFLARKLDVVSVKGKQAKIAIYELLAQFNPQQKEIAPTQEQIELCNLFSKGYEAYSQGKVQEAKELFQKTLQSFPNDFATQLYLERVRENE